LYQTLLISVIFFLCCFVIQDATRRAPFGEDASHAFYHCSFVITGIYANLYCIYSLVSFSANDYEQRTILGKFLNDALTSDVSQKKYHSLELLSFNFMHPTSIKTWFDLHILSLDVDKAGLLRSDYNLMFLVCATLVGLYALILDSYYGYFSTYSSPLHFCFATINFFVIMIELFRALSAASALNQVW
jgi:hypothetical protein